MNVPKPKQKVIQIALAATKPSPGLADAVFESRFVDELPGDPVTENVPRQVRNACYTRVDPTPVEKPQLLAWSDDMARALGVALPETPTGLEAKVLAGNASLPGMKPYAARYGGHQFGHWAGQLGDGRAIALGELVAPGGARHELQLKGAGLTPYSRTADGRAVLRSSVREFLCSEAMFHLGIPTTRALSLAGTGENVVRDMFYDGNSAPEPGAVVCRVAPSFVRFGNFEILAAQNEHDVLKRLADYVIRHYFGHLVVKGVEPSEAVYGQWFAEICQRTAALMVEWMRVGFVHGVMNTDNMSILGLTIDYGPYGWLEGYDPQWTPNTTDLPGRRYCYGNQPNIGQWNLVRLANALAPLIKDTAVLEAGIKAYSETFEQSSARMLADKLGLEYLGIEGDEDLVGGLFEVLGQTETDMTLFFRGLADVPLGDAGEDAFIAPLRRAFYSEEAFAPEPKAKLIAWLRSYVARVRQDGVTADEHRGRMNRVNPKYVARNYLAQQAIDALAQGDDSVLARLMVVLRNPYDDQPAHDELAGRRPEWARHKAGCSALSCSS